MLIIELCSILFIFTSLGKGNCCARVVSPVMSKLRETLNDFVVLLVYFFRFSVLLVLFRVAIVVTPQTLCSSDLP